MYKKITILMAAFLLMFSYAGLAQVVSGTTYSTPSVENLPTGWSGNDGGGTSYIKLIAAEHYIQTADFEQEGFTSITVKARKFGGPSATQAQISVSWYNSEDEETVLGTIDPTNTTLTNYTINTPTAESGTGYIKIQNKGASSNKGSGVSEVTITYTEPGGTHPTTYTVTYKANGAGANDVVDTYSEGADVTLRNANTFTYDGYTFSEWNTQADGDGDPYDAGDVIENIQANIELYAIWAENPVSDEQWVLTSLADLTANDVFVIVGNDSYAMSNDNGTTSAPVPVEVTIDGNNLTGSIAANIQWNVTGNATDGYSFLPNGTTEYLFCNTSAGSSSNNNLRIGNGGNYNRILFVLNNNDHLVTNDEYTARYVSLYNTQDWRGYTSESSAASMTFYKKVTGGIVPPSITANNVEIAYDVTGGSIAYTINEPDPVGTMTAAIVEGGTIANLNLGTIANNAVPFTCDANTTGIARTATVTLTYTYDTDQTVTKDVTVTQAAAPVIYTTIPELFAAATSTETSVLVTFNNWVVSGVYSNGKSVFVTDNNGNGFVIYYSSDMSDTYAAGDILSGTAVTCTLKLYNGFAELLNVNVDDLTITEGGTVSVANIEMANLAGVNTGALVHYDNLTCTIDNNKYYLTDGTTTIQLYNAIYAFSSTFEADHIYNITGVYQQYNSTKEILPRSADDIEEVVIAEPSITLNTSVSVPAEGGLGIIPVEYVNIDDTYYPVLLYYNENQEQVEASYYEWITLNFNDDDNVQYNCDPNTIVETRSIYFKVLAHDYDNNEVTSDLVTITQDAYVATASITVDPDMVEATAAGGDGTLSIILNNMTISTDTQLNVVYCYENGEFITNLDDMPNWLECIIMKDNEAYVVYYSVGENLGTEAQTAYFKVYGLDDNGTTEAYSNLVTIMQEAGETPVAESWVLTDLADLTEGDVFVIVGTDADDDTFALPNNATSAAPAATSITVANGMLATEPDDVLKWNISGNATDGYTFYPNGDTENWLFCNGSNNGVRVGNTNDNKTFHMNDDNYLVHNATSRILSIYINQGNPQDWRCYTNTNNNPVAISFYKKVGDEPQIASITVTPSLVEAPATETEGTLTVTYVNIAEVEDEIYFCDANGEAATYNWITADYDTDNNVYYVIEANTGGARTAYFKVYGLDAEANDVYSNLVTVTQAAAPQQFDLTVEAFENLELITFVNDEMTMETEGTIQVTEGAQVMLSIVANEGYVIETLMVNGVNHAADIAEDFTYSFAMPAENVTISATAVEVPAPVGGDYVRITALDQLTDGSKVIFAARFDDNATEYYAMSNTSSGKPTGVLFTSATADEDEVLPASIVDEEDSYYWTVGVSADGYTFTNANGELIGYSSSTNFATGGDNTEWSIESGTSVETAMVPNYTGFVITNVNNDGRAFALNTSHNFGPYAKSNMNNNSAGNYNFYLDLFVQNEAPTPTETYTLEITGYGDSEGGYYLIASPVASDVRPSAENGFLTNAYDLYWFDQTEDEEWRNYEAGEFDLVSGMGYLYASQEGTTLTFTGTPYDGDGSVSLVKDDEAQFSGWNLVGNPFGQTAYIDREDFYIMNPETGSELIQSSGEIAIMQGIFVIAEEDGETLTFSTEAPNQSANLTMNLIQSRGAVIDRAIVRFNEGRQLPKFQLNAESTKLYIPQGSNDYAVVNSNAQGEMPVNFKAQSNGTYTISINTENLEANYLHLIDNMTGTNIDLLQTPSYTFEAKTTDYASRFRLVFNVTGVEENTTSTEPFAFFNGSEWVVSNMGEATLQVVDMLGRIVSSETVNGNATMSTANLGAGVYVMRLVNGENVMTQKIVVR